MIDDKSIKAEINHVNNRHNIVLIDEEDEGIYDCQASNHVGQARKSLNVSGIVATYITCIHKSRYGIFHFFYNTF